MPIPDTTTEHADTNASDQIEAVPAEGAASAADEPKSPAGPPRRSRPTGGRKWLIGAIGVLVLVLACVFGIPRIELALNTVSTDDAYVNGHVTFVAPRVSGQISRVFVEDNNRVHKGEILAQLDKEPYEVAVSQKQAEVDTAMADLQAATAAARGIEAEARSRRWALQHAIENVDNQIAVLDARVAALNKSRAALALAQSEFDRARVLVAKNDVSREVYDERQAQLTTASADVAQTLAEIYQVRVSLGLSAHPDNGAALDSVPRDLDETFSGVLQAQSNLIQSAAGLGVVHTYNQNPKEMLAQFEKLGNIDTTFARLAAEAPAVKEAEAKLETARRELAQAKLNLRYCDIVADIDGVVTRRNVNPGDYVQIGQNLMAVRSLKDIWVDANFKETQLGDLRIGMPVDVYVDMYGGRHVFKGRVSGFTNGTGSTLALLPAENATGNFVKVVQRLPVRIDLEGYDPDKDTLFIGTSVVPYVYIDKPPTGPDAGKFLQSSEPQAPVPGASQNTPVTGK
jgi:membrane fusion protein, multidrug efflux system